MGKMALFLEVTSGADEGQKFKLVAGVRIGRTTGEIILAEPKMSALHAQVKSSENGKLYLIDSGSSNGIKINGSKVQKVALMDGVTFRIGGTTFRVREEADEPPEAEPVMEEGWRGVLRTHVPMLEAQNSTLGPALLPFSSLVELHFIEGVQADTKILLGYGPRKAGGAVLDIELQDPGSPEVAFEIRPLEDGTILFQTNHPQTILLNDNSFATESLKSGDQIRVGSSLIEVRLIS
jgi:hypothetical protein